MAIVGKKLRSLQGNRLGFMCPGCKELHQVTVLPAIGPRGAETSTPHPVWGYNGNPDAPTFTPSIMVWWSEPSDIDDEFDDPSKDRQCRCHSFVTDGRIQFLSDCTHALAGQTVDLPDLEAE
jgi:hypothetical protein